MAKVNPEILIWARDTAGLSIEEACKKLGFKDNKKFSCSEQLINLETGQVEPSRTTLHKMVKCYRRPLVAFYLSKPPIKGNRGQDFRTLPFDLAKNEQALIDSLIRDIKNRQEIIRSNLEEEEAKPLSFVKSMKIENGKSSVLSSILNTLKFDQLEFRKKSSPKDAFAYLRTVVESIGVYVLLIHDLGSHHSNISVESFRGFSISDSLAPFIVINDNDTKAACSFTLVHELVHLWLGHTGISNLNFGNDIEKFCNDIAGDFLLPEDEALMLNVSNAWDIDQLSMEISVFAEKRNLSSSMVAYKLFRLGIIDMNKWSYLHNQFRIFYQKNKQNQKIKKKNDSSGPDYYIVRRYQLGKNLTSVVNRMVLDGSLTLTKAGKVMGVKPGNVNKVLDIYGSF